MSKSKLIHEMRRFLREEDGPTATEYAVMLALIILVALSSIGALGSKVADIFTEVHTKIGQAAGV